MVDYIELLRKDLVEQFKEKPLIDGLAVAFGRQLNDVFRFFEDLRDRRNLHSAEGRQLDGAGDIVVLTRTEAGEIAGKTRDEYTLDDETYRQYLIFKVWKNTNSCTYYDIMKALRMFWDRPLYYREDPAEPATMIFDTDTLPPDVDVPKLLNAPLIKAAGVSIKIVAHTETPDMEDFLEVYDAMGRGLMTTTLPEIPLDVDMSDVVKPIPSSVNITQTNLPEMEE